MSSIFDRIGNKEPLPSHLRTRLHSETTEPPPKEWRLDELADAEISDPDTFLAETLARGSILLISGRRSVGKTYLTLAMAAAIALGRSLGHLACKRGSVLYLSQEMGEAAIRKRIRRLFPDPGERSLIGDNLTVVCKAKFKLDSEEASAELSRLVAKNKPDVVFIDALRDVKGAAKENSNDDMGALLVLLRDTVAVRFNCGIVLLHHKGKTGEDGQDRGSRGASALEDVPEDVIYLTGEKGQARRKGTFEKTREGTLEGQSFWYEISSEDERPNVVLFALGATNEDDEDEGSDLFRAKKLATVLHEEGGLTKDEIKKRMSWTPDTLKRALRAGREGDILIRKGGGAGRGNKSVYECHQRWVPEEKGATGAIG